MRTITVIMSLAFVFLYSFFILTLGAYTWPVMQ